MARHREALAEGFDRNWAVAPLARVFGKILLLAPTWKWEAQSLFRLQAWLPKNLKPSFQQLSADIPIGTGILYSNGIFFSLTWKEGTMCVTDVVGGWIQAH